MGKRDSTYNNINDQSIITKVIENKREQPVKAYYCAPCFGFYLLVAVVVVCGDWTDRRLSLFVSQLYRLRFCGYFVIIVCVFVCVVCFFTTIFCCVVGDKAPQTFFIFFHVSGKQQQPQGLTNVRYVGLMD